MIVMTTGSNLTCVFICSPHLEVEHLWGSLSFLPVILCLSHFCFAIDSAYSLVAWRRSWPVNSPPRNSFACSPTPVVTRVSSSSKNLPAAAGSPMDIAKRQLGLLEGLQSNREFSQVAPIADEAARFIADPANCLVNGQQLIAYLIRTLFPDQRCLDILLLGVPTT